MGLEGTGSKAKYLRTIKDEEMRGGGVCDDDDNYIEFEPDYWAVKRRAVRYVNE